MCVCVCCGGHARIVRWETVAQADYHRLWVAVSSSQPALRFPMQFTHARSREPVLAPSQSQSHSPPCPIFRGAPAEEEAAPAAPAAPVKMDVMTALQEVSPRWITAVSSLPINTPCPRLFSVACGQRWLMARSFDHTSVSRS